jgi:drug/metabolite transporter (DMT)-like permease
LNASLFTFVVFAWGLTWYAIKLELGPVPTETSIFWRFLVAAAIMWIGLALVGRLERVPLRAHVWFAALGVALFFGNFLFFYNAERFIASGVVSVVFATASAFNVFNQWLFNGARPSARTALGALIGVAGVAFLFADQLAATAAGGGGSALGLLLSIGGTYCFSLGNLASRPAAEAAGDLPNAIARAMTWGTAMLAVVVAARGLSFAPSTEPVYVGALLYLAAVGSALAFLAYLALVARIGPERAAYTTVLSPVIALAVSWMLEGYQWSPWALVGAPLILIGNVVIFLPKFGRDMVQRRPSSLQAEAAPGEQE